MGVTNYAHPSQNSAKGGGEIPPPHPPLKEALYGILK